MGSLSMMKLWQSFQPTAFVHETNEHMLAKLQYDAGMMRLRGKDAEDVIASRLGRAIVG